jgi:hypothetical protein
MNNRPDTLPILQRILDDIKTIKKWHDIERDTVSNYYTVRHRGRQLGRYESLENVVKLLIQAEIAETRIKEMDKKYPPTGE